MTTKVVDTTLGVWPQWVACIIVTLLSISFGLVIGWTSPYLARLTSHDDLFHVSNNEASWVAALMPFGRLFGAIAGAIILEYYGSKMALMTTGVPVIVGWICIILATSAPWLYVSRTCAGISIGMFFSCFSLYVGEIASAQIRGALVSIIMNGLPIGTLLGNVMGVQVSIMWFGIISLILNICYVVIFPLLPHTPHYYVRRNNMDEARRTIQWYHRKSNVEEELEIIGNYVRDSGSMSLRERLKQIGEKRNRRVFGIVILLFIFMQLSGLNTVVFYMEIIAKRAQVTSIEPKNVVIIASSVGILIGWISVYLIDRCGRRVLMSASCCCVIAAMVLLGLHFMLLDLNCDPKKLEWLPIIAMMLFMMMSIGLIPVPSTLLGELFPAYLRSIAGFMVSVTSALSAFVCTITYQPMIDTLTEKYVFGIYAVLMTGCLIFSVTCVPETKGKTLQEIQEMLDGRNRSENSVQTEYG
nr:PREDICTED: facilitated trehalose transporter Tret1-like [Megachile rotundata]